MKALILAAGYGTRLYPLVKDTPKAFLEVKDKPLLEHILGKLKVIQDLKEILIVTNNKFDGQFREWAAGYFADVPVTVINDQTNSPEDRLGSIGDIQYALEQASLGDDLIVVGSDNLFNFNIEDFISFCRQKKSPAIGVYDIGDLEEAKKFGVVALDNEQKIVRFQEKPSQPASTLIAMCFYYFPESALGCFSEYLHEVEKSDTAGDYIRWLSEKKNVFGFPFCGKWYDIGSIESYHDAQEHFS